MEDVQQYFREIVILSGSNFAGGTDSHTALHTEGLHVRALTWPNKDVYFDNSVMCALERSRRGVGCKGGNP